MENLVFGDLVIAVAERAGTLELAWTGKSNDRQPAKKLDPYLGAAVDEAVQRGVALELRFENLEHFNSSTITSIIGLVQNAHGKRVKLLLTFDKSLKWQKLSFDALRVLAKGDGLLEIRGA